MIPAFIRKKTGFTVTSLAPGRLFIRIQTTRMDQEIFRQYNITVRSGKDRFQILAREKKGTLRSLVVFFRAEEVTGMISVRGHFRLDDLNRLIKKTQEWSEDKPGKLPASVPVLRA